MVGERPLAEGAACARAGSHRPIDLSDRTCYLESQYVHHRPVLNDVPPKRAVGVHHSAFCSGQIVMLLANSIGGFLANLSTLNSSRSLTTHRGPLRGRENPQFKSREAPSCFWVLKRVYQIYLWGKEELRTP